MLTPVCMRSLATIGYEMIEKALADCKSDNTTNNKNNGGGHWGPDPGSKKEMS